MSTSDQSTFVSWRRLKALCWKESLQILRDPSSKIIAFVLPIVMLFIFGYGINLDSNRIRIGILDQSGSHESRQFVASLRGSPWFEVTECATLQTLQHEIVEGRLRGAMILSSDFERLLQGRNTTAPTQVIADGTEPQIANFVANYARGAWEIWLEQRARERGETISGGVELETRVWFNPSALSRNYLIPGSITIIMTVIGAILTALVIAREWERGTMEALLATPITRTEFLLSKIVPYYVLGIVSLTLCVLIAKFVMGVPFRGSFFILWLVSTFFILSVLGLGLLISSLTRNQFNAGQVALNAAFLPALMLSGFIYEISSMPWVIRIVTYLIPARYFVTSLQTLFLADNVWSVLWPDLLFLAGSSVFFLALTARFTRMHLE